VSTAVEVLPWLPRGWLDGIAAGDYVERARGEVGSTKKAWVWIKRRPSAKGDPCAVMDQALQAGIEHLEAGGSAHDELTSRTYQLISLGAEGHRGTHTALLSFARRFVEEVSGNRRATALSGGETGTIRGADEARREVNRAVLGAVKLMLGHLSQPEMVDAGLGNGAAGCSCWDEPKDADGNKVDSGLARDPFEYRLTDTGNAEQLADLSNGNLLWVSAGKTWYAYDAEHCSWRGDEHVGVQWAMRIAPRVELAAQQRFDSAKGLSKDKSGTSEFSDADLAVKQGGILKRHAERCGQSTVITSMLTLAKSLPGMSKGFEDFDARGDMLGVGAGEVLLFEDDGLVVRKAEREDYLTKSTHVPYVPGATDSLWENYLETFIPDQRLRDYVQRLLGYGLIGGNPRRLLVFLHGPTSSGKSTLVEAVGAAVGDYGGPFGVSVFRDKQDDAPRPDLLAALGLRFAFASEAGSEQHLHADQLKRLTGGDTISARNMNDRVMTRLVPQFLPFIATNDPPQIRNADAALWRRMLTVPFDRQVAGKREDTLARERLRASPAARTAILAWLVEGWERYRANGLDDVPQDMRTRGEEFKSGVSEFHAWFYETVEFAEGAAADNERLYDLYRDKMVADGVRDFLTPARFGFALNKEGVAKAKGTTKDGKRIRYRPGIRIKKATTS
jgi:putative DNA primase/helicase